MDRRTELQRRVNIATQGVHNSPGTNALIRDLWDRVSELETDVEDLEAKIAEFIDGENDGEPQSGYYRI